ncbi:MAG: Stp1/IreP family PP2C-type Ser/Thr phosphatase [Candidatus Altiarchaeia archaeon]
MEYSYASDRGRLRQKDEDSILIVRESFSYSGAAHERTLFLLADGMGGRSAGEIASMLAVKKIAEKVMPHMSSRGDADPKTLLCGAIEYASREIAQYSAGNVNLSGMGSTIVSAILSGYDLHVAHAGDSRLYVIDPQTQDIRRITKDHSVVQELIAAGKLTTGEAGRHPQRGLLTRALGTHPAVHPDSCSVGLEMGSYVLLCCDGLTDVLPEEEIKETILKASDLKNACSALIDAANNAGGPDNISVILIRV